MILVDKRTLNSTFICVVFDCFLCSCVTIFCFESKREEGKIPFHKHKMTGNYIDLCHVPTYVSKPLGITCINNKFTFDTSPTSTTSYNKCLASILLPYIAAIPFGNVQTRSIKNQYYHTRTKTKVWKTTRITIWFKVCLLMCISNIMWWYYGINSISIGGGVYPPALTRVSCFMFWFFWQAKQKNEKFHSKNRRLYVPCPTYV